MRAFVAIDLPDAAVRALEPVLEALPLGRPADPDQLHLTLAFLGEQPDDLVEAAHWELETIRAAPLSLRLSGLETFGGREGMVLWAGVAEPAPVADLASRVRSRLHGAGLPLERRRFRPHVTLARLSAAEAAEGEKLARFLSRWSAFPAPEVEIEDFVLYRSTLTKAGAIHEALARYPLSP